MSVIGLDSPFQGIQPAQPGLTGGPSSAGTRNVAIRQAIEAEFGVSADDIVDFLGLQAIRNELASNLPQGHLRALGMDRVRQHEVSLTAYAMRTLTARFGEALLAATEKGSTSILSIFLAPRMWAEYENSPLPDPTSRNVLPRIPSTPIKSVNDFLAVSKRAGTRLLRKSCQFLPKENSAITLS